MAAPQSSFNKTRSRQPDELHCWILNNKTSTKHLLSVSLHLEESHTAMSNHFTSPFVQQKQASEETVYTPWKPSSASMSLWYVHVYRLKSLWTISDLMCWKKKWNCIYVCIPWKSKASLEKNMPTSQQWRCWECCNIWFYCTRLKQHSTFGIGSFYISPKVKQLCFTIFGPTLY